MLTILKKYLGFDIVGNTIGILISMMVLPALLVISFCSRFSKRKLDIGIGPIPLINNLYFKTALEKKGYSVETFANTVYYTTDEFDIIYTKDKHPIYNAFPFLFFIRAIHKYKCVYIYFNGFILYDTMILRLIEPFLLRLAGIKVVVMPYGGDHQTYMYSKNLVMQNAICRDYPLFYKFSQNRVRRDVERWTKGANCVLAHQDCVDYLPYWDRVRWSLFGVDTDKICPTANERHDRLRILHAPNHRNIKGSDAVEKAIKELEGEGFEIEYVYAHGVSNSEVIKLIQSSDIIVDQLIIGAYSMFAMESLACGKPVICYIRPDLKEFYETIGVVEADELPFISANILTIKQVLKRLIQNRDQFSEIGKKSRDYVVKYHSVDAIGDFFDCINREVIGLR